MADQDALADTDALDAELILRLLAERPRNLDQLRTALAKESVFTDTEQLRLELQWRGEVCEFTDGAWGHVPTLADGVVLTHRLTEEEVALDVLAADHDLGLWARLADEGHSFSSGGELRARWTGQDGPRPGGANTVLSGPDGWLDGCQAGDLIGLRLRDGAIVLEQVDASNLETPPEMKEALVAEATAMAEAYLRRHEEDGDPIPGAEIDEVVLAVRRRHSDAFRAPMPPVAEVLEASGFEVWRGYVGVAGAPWHDEPPSLGEAGRAAYTSWMRMLETHRHDGAIPGAAELARVARGFDSDALEVIGTELSFDPDREPLAGAMADAVTGLLSAVPLYLQSRAAEGRGEAARQMALLESAVAADPDLGCALVDLAELYSVRGDAHAAHRLYQQADVEPTYPGFTVLRRFLPAAEGAVGRNRPCPCGSGKKYKLCHGRDLAHPFPMRTDWLWTKLVTFALRARQRDTVMQYAAILAGPDASGREQMIAALTDGLAHDLALFDDAVLDQFLDERGILLPDDERALAQQWLHNDRRLLEVVEVRPLRGLRCRDLLTGEELEILDKTMPGQLEPLDLIYGRPLPDGAGVLRVQDAPRLVPRMMRPQLLHLLREEAPGDQIASFFAPSNQLPQLRTSEGEDLVVCTARYDVDDADTVWTRLQEEGLEPTGEDQLTQTTEIPGRGNVIRGTIARGSGRIVVETNAVERLRRLQALLQGVDPHARLVDESTIPAEQMLAEQHELAPDGPGTPARDSQVPPEVEQELLAEMMRRHEESWPDIELPALGGRTPRQAAVDPELRPDLEALLDDFAWVQRRDVGGPQMDLDRLRRELGLARP